MNTILKKTKKEATVLLLICLLIALGACSAPVENDTTSAIESFIIEETVSETTTETTTEATTATVTALSKTPSETATTKDSAFQIATEASTLSIPTQTDGNSLFADLKSLNLKATPDDEQAIVQVVRTIYPSFDPVDYKSSKTVNDVNDYFLVSYYINVGEYGTNKGYEIKFEGNQAIQIIERGVSLSVPSASVIANLPAVTDEIVQAAYKQGQEETHAKNPNFVVQEQTGYAFYNLATNECYYNVRTVYTTSATSPAKGVVDTQYKIR